MDKIDLHVHTTASDGTRSPREVVALAAMQGIRAIAITDHDTMAAIPEAGEAGELLNVTVVPGIEISSDYLGRDVHVLGYFLDDKAPALLDYLEWTKKSRLEQHQKMLDRLKRKGCEITMEELTEANPGAIINRMHIARMLMEKGFVPNTKEAFRRYIGEGRSCYVDRERIPFRDASQLIRRCGGVSVLAHPLQYGFDKTKLEAMVKAAAEAEFSGMEIFYSGYTQNDMNKLFSLAEKYSLLPTGGSDYHGDNKPGIQLGTGDGKLTVPAYVLLMLAKSQYS